jgi:hypothetical protein
MTGRRSARLLAAGALALVACLGWRDAEIGVPGGELALELLLDGDSRDSSGNEYHGQIEGATPIVDRVGRQGMAYHFGGDDWIAVAAPPDLSDQALTVSLWAQYNSGEFEWWNNCMLAQDDGDDSGQRRIIQLSTIPRSICWHRMGEGDAQSPVPLAAEVWYHIAATYDGHYHRLYVDGLLQDTREGSLSTHREEPLYLGRKGSEEPGFNFRGALDDVRIYNRPLSSEEIVRLYLEDPAAGRTQCPSLNTLA